MSDYSCALAQGKSAQAIATACASRLHGHGGHNLGFVYATDPIAPQFGKLVDGLREHTGISHWVGTVGHGICGPGTEIFDGAAAVVLTGKFPDPNFNLLPPVTRPTPPKGLTQPGFVAGFGIVHGDPRSQEITAIVKTLADTTGAFLVGGLSSADNDFPQVAGGKLTDKGVSGVLLGGRLNVAVGLTQGCSPVGPTHEVTSCDGQLLIQLDGRNAYETLCEDVGIAEGADPRPWLRDVHAAVPVSGTDQADYLVRNLMGLDTQRGLVAVTEAFEKGDRVMFVRRDVESARKDLNRMLDDLKERLSAPPKAGLYFSCVARGPNLFDETSHELKAIRAAFGDIPIAGFFGNGEISNDRLYGYTGVLALFS
ncbi:MAG: FIST N-terminal domain-containing protein [Hyphomicrobiaceae bacterium]